MPNNEYQMIVANKDYPGKKYHGGYVYCHIHEFWRKTGRLPLPNHVIHHLNGDKHDNSWENLEEISRSQHVKEHHTTPPILHGKRSGYRRGCRCQLCKDANNAIYRKYCDRYKDAYNEKRRLTRRLVLR